MHPTINATAAAEKKAASAKGLREIKNRTERPNANAFARTEGETKTEYLAGHPADRGHNERERDCAEERENEG